MAIAAVAVTREFSTKQAFASCLLGDEELCALGKDGVFDAE